MKKLLTLALCSIMVLGLGSCKKKPSSSPVTSNPDTTETSTPDSSSEESTDTGTSDTGSTDTSTDSGTSSESGTSSDSNTSSDSSSSSSTTTDPVEPEQKTFYFQNNWLWTDVCVHAYDSTLSSDNYQVEWPGMPLETIVGQDGENTLYDIYLVDVIDWAGNYDTIIISGCNPDKITEDNPTGRDESPAISIASITEGHAIYMDWDFDANCNKTGSYLYVPTVEYTAYSITVNGEVDTEAAQTEIGNNKAVFKVTLEENDIVNVYGDETPLLAEDYVATLAGEYTFTVNHKNVVTIDEPEDPNAPTPETYTYTVTLNWDGSSDGAKIYAWVWGTDINGSWIECQTGEGNVVFFESEEANYTHCIPMRMPNTATAGSWEGAWNRGSSTESGHSDIAFTNYAATGYWVNP